VTRVRTWSVGTDGGVVTAECPEPLRSPSGPMPEWMSRAAGAIRDALRELPIGEGTVLEATLADSSGEDGDLGEALLSNVGVPETQVHAGVRLGRLPARAPGVVQTYRRVPAAPIADGNEMVVAAAQVPIAGVFELDSARRVWLLTRRVVVATLPAGTVMEPPGVALHARLLTGSEREHGNVPLIRKLLDGVRAAFQVDGGVDDIDGAALQLARDLAEGQDEMHALLSSPRGALLGARATWHAADIAVVPGASSQLEIELRAAQPGPS
jgi:hypothetical protein